MATAGKPQWNRSQGAVFALVSILFLALFICAASQCPAQEVASRTGNPLDDSTLESMSKGFDDRVLTAFEAEHGKPLVRAKKLPPFGLNRGNYVQAYSWSSVDFATRCFFLNEQIEEANAALQEKARHYLDNPKDICDRDSFHWHSEMICRLIEQYGANGTVAPSLMTRETEEIVMEPLWLYASNDVPLFEAKLEKSQTWHIYESENHHARHFTSAWQFAKLAKDHPRYRDLKYADGASPAQQYEAWTAYIEECCRERAQKGHFVECPLAVCLLQSF